MSEFDIATYDSSRPETPDGFDVRKALQMEPAEFIRKYSHVGKRLADKHRKRGEHDLADEIERRVQSALEGSR